MGISECKSTPLFNHIRPTPKQPKASTWIGLFSNIHMSLLFFVLLFSSTVLAEETVGFLAGAGGLGDQSFNDMTFSGLGKAQKEFGFKLIIEETQTSSISQEGALDRLITQGATIVVANGSGLLQTVLKFSQQYPKIFFIINDCPLEGYHNITSTDFANNEGAYLAGLLAASMSTSGSIGFIGGVNIPVIHTFLNGFKLGAQSISSDINITTQYLSPKDDFSGFEKPQLGYEKATKMYNNGIDIIFSVAGMSGNGVIQAAQKMEKFVIGVDANQDHMAKGYVLTSMMKRLDRATYLEVAKIMKNAFEPGINFYSLHNGGVSLTPMQYTKHLVPDKVLNSLKKAELDLIDGKISFNKDHSSN